jgi:nitrate/nitrite transporter NarK
MVRPIMVRSGASSRLAAGAKVIEYDSGPGETVKTPQFYFLWLVSLFGAGAGLMGISQAVPMGVELAKVERVAAAGALGRVAIFNGLDRPAFGAISDTIGCSNATMLALALYILALLGVLRSADSLAMYSIGINTMGFAYGGYLA